MTPHELKALFDSRPSPLEFAAAMADIDEKTRQSLSKMAQDIYREVRKEEQSDVHNMKGRNSLARLIILACCPWSQARRVRGNRWSWIDQTRDSFADTVVRILIDRRPDWAGDWVELQLDVGSFPWECSLGLKHIHELVRTGVIDRPTSDGYARLLGSATGVYEKIPADELIDELDIWRLFEVDTLAFDFVPEPKKAHQVWGLATTTEKGQVAHTNLHSWPRKMYELSRQGRLDRNRLIDAILSAFWRDFRTPMRIGLLRFLEILDPTDAERKTHESAYRELLRHDYGPIVGMAIRSLTRLQQYSTLDTPAFLEAVSPVFELPIKTHAMRALTLIDRTTRKDGRMVVASLPAVIAALNHLSPDVQERAIDLLRAWHKAGIELDTSDILAQATMLAPHQRLALEGLVNDQSISQHASHTNDGSQPECHTDDHYPAIDPSDSVGDFESCIAAVARRVNVLPKSIQEMCHVADLEERLRHGLLPKSFNPPRSLCPVLAAATPIVPIQDIDELIDISLSVASGTGHAEDSERVIEGILRLGRQSTDEFAAKTEGLRALTNSSLEALRFWQHSFLAGVRHAEVLFIGRWLGLEAADDIARSTLIEADLSPLPHWLAQIASPSRSHPLSALEWRFAELYQRLERGEYGPVLAIPTHENGWIDVRTFVERLTELCGLGIPIGKLDFIAGLLRLAPDFRELALPAAGRLPQPYSRIVNYALGGDERPNRRDRSCADEWLAAGKVRSPGETLTELEVLKLNPDEPDGITPAVFRFDFRVSAKAEQNARWTGRLPFGFVDVSPNCHRNDDFRSRPTVSLARLLSDNKSIDTLGMMTVPLTTVAPSNTDSAYALLTYYLTCHIDDPSSDLPSVATFLAPIYQRDVAWSHAACLALWLALISRNDGIRGAGIDAWIDGIQDGRADVDRAAKALLEIDSGGSIKLNRLVDSLREIARTSTLAERFIAAILDQLIASWARLPRAAHHVLELQLELLVNLRHEVSHQSRRALSQVSGSGKVAKLAKRLCKLRAEALSPVMRQAALAAADGRLTRAESIARHLHTALVRKIGRTSPLFPNVDFQIDWDS